MEDEIMLLALALKVAHGKQHLHGTSFQRNLNQTMNIMRMWWQTQKYLTL